MIEMILIIILYFPLFSTALQEVSKIIFVIFLYILGILGYSDIFSGEKKGGCMIIDQPGF